MTRYFALLLRLTVIASAIAMLFFCVRTAHAQDFQVAPGSLPVTQAPPMDASPPLGLNGARDPYAYYAPQAGQPNGYYSALGAPTQQPPRYYAPASQYAPMAAPPQYGSASGYGAVSQVTPLPYTPVSAVAPTDSGYTLGPGDKVRVTVFDEPDLSGEYQLDGNGMIRMPLIGTLRAGGYTAAGLEGWVRNALSPNYLKNPKINVEISAYRPVYVVGAVVKPGQYAYVNDMSLLNAVGLAGGFTDQAVESTVYVRHEGEAKEEAISTDKPLLIRPGDTVRVKTTLFWDAMDMFAPLSGPAEIATARIQ